MRHFHIMAALAVLLVSACGVARQTPEEQQRNAQIIKEQMDNRSYRIDINYMIPLRGPARSVSSYSVRIDGSTIDSHLPYMGEVRNVPYGGGKGLNFKDEIQGYSDSGMQKDGRAVVITVKNDEDTYVYSLLVYDNGYANLTVSGRNRDNISYRGTFRLEEEED